MKGITLTRDAAIGILLFLIVLFIIFAVFQINIFAYGLPATSSDYYISQLCSDWTQKDCSSVSASDGSIHITVNKQDKTLYDLCASKYGSVKWLSGCKEFCKGCPT